MSYCFHVVLCFHVTCCYDTYGVISELGHCSEVRGNLCVRSRFGFVFKEF